MIDVSPKTRRLLELAMLKGVGAKSLATVSRIRGFQRIPIDGLVEHLTRKVGNVVDQSTLIKAEDEADRQIEHAQKEDARIISSADPDYPRLLMNTPDDPQLLFVKGNLSCRNDGSVAIVGTRKPTKHGEIITQRITEYFVANNWSIVSGLAMGCDAIAHESALGGRGHTVAVMAHGLQTVAPPRNRKLAERILASGGAMVSEFRFGIAPRPEYFVRRDRSQAGLARGVVMVQSDLTGGSLHASRAAVRYRRWLAVPFPTEQDRSRKEPKIEANLLLTGDRSQDSADLLECGTEALQRQIIPLGCRGDYASMLQWDVPAAPPSPKHDLLPGMATQ